VIIAHYNHSQEQEYLIQIHQMDGETFATCYKNGEFHHYSKWDEQEQEFIQRYITEASNNPQFPKVIHIGGDK